MTSYGETSSVTALSCGDCGYSFVPRARFLRLVHCPRCLAKRKVAVPLRDQSEPGGPRRTRPAQQGEGR